MSETIIFTSVSAILESWRKFTANLAVNPKAFFSLGDFDDNALEMLLSLSQFERKPLIWQLLFQNDKKFGCETELYNIMHEVHMPWRQQFSLFTEFVRAQFKYRNAEETYFEKRCPNKIWRLTFLAWLTDRARLTVWVWSTLF